MISAKEDFDITKGVLNFPVYRASTIGFNSHNDFAKAYASEDVYNLIEIGSHSAKVVPSYAYGNGANPSQVALSNKIAALCDSKYAIMFSSGMSALTNVFSTIVKSGDKVFVPRGCFYRFSQFVLEESQRIKFDLIYYENETLDGFVPDEKTSFVFIETPLSVSFGLSDIKKIVEQAKKIGATTVADCTWATPLLLKPLDLGIDIAVHAVTKYISGHSDLRMGAVLTNNLEFAKKIAYRRELTGDNVSPDDCYLVGRGVPTLELRIQKSAFNSLKVATVFKNSSKVMKVNHLAFFEGEQAQIRDEYFHGYSGLFSVEMRKIYDMQDIENAFSKLKYFCIGSSWGGCKSVIIHLSKGIYCSSANKSVFRLYCGLEGSEDLISDATRLLDSL